MTPFLWRGDREGHRLALLLDLLADGQRHTQSALLEQVLQRQGGTRSRHRDRIFRTLVSAKAQGLVEHAAPGWRITPAGQTARATIKAAQPAAA